MTLKRAYDALLQEVCVRYGFCGSIIDGQPRHVDDFVPERGSITADQFTNWLFQAEAKDRAQFEQHRSSIKAAFVRHLGSETIDAATLR